ncbi:MAG: MerR family DNA-binding protein [Steroidobacteraceae bacterium]
MRHYERSGLLAPKTRPRGYRRYSEVEVSPAAFIQRAQALGFTLIEVRELPAFFNRRDVAQVKRIAQQQLADVERRIAALESMRCDLSSLIESCPGHRRAMDCPILRALGREDHE